MRLAGAVALVTGASSGIGRETARRLADAGSTVLLSGRDGERLEQVARETGGQVLTADLAVAGAPAALARRALAVHGGVDVAVLNAGLGWAGPFARMPPESIGELVTVNLAAPMLLARELLPGMLARGRGHLCLIGSVAGVAGVPQEAVYAATKAALDAFAESLGAECAGTGVGVSLVVPAVVDTGFFARRGTPYQRRRPRPVPPQRVAAAVQRCVERDRPRVVVPPWLGLAVRARGLSPGLYRRLARRSGGSVGALEPPGTPARSGIEN